MPKKKNKSGFRFKKDLTKKILNLFSENPSKLYNYKQISAKLTMCSDMGEPGTNISFAGYLCN